MVTHECFKGLADPIRYAILGLLSEESRNVTDLATRFEVSRPAISRHLRVLRETGLVTEERVGRQRTYSMAPAMLEAAAAWLRTAARGDASAGGLAANTSPPVGEQGGWRQW